MIKVIIILFILLSISGCVDSSKVSQVSSETKICNSNYSEDQKNIVLKLSQISDFNCDNLTKYLNYLKNYPNCPYEDAIYLINMGINSEYSPYLMELVKSKYFILGNLPNYLTNKKSSVSSTISYVNAGLYRDYYNEMEPTDIKKDLLMIVNKYYYLTSDYEPTDLEYIDSNYSKGNNNRLRHEAAVSFEKMAAAAALDGISIFNLSAYRTYKSQVTIYNRSVTKYGVAESDKTSARPGNSEHQTGLTLDVNSVDDSFQYTNAYKWLTNNAYKYGFILRYPKGKEDITGYSYEPWHYRYVGINPAKQIHDESLTFEEYYAYYVKNK